MNHSAAHSIRNLPGPKGVPFLGNLTQIDRKRIYRSLLNWNKSWGPLFRFRLGHKEFVVVSELDEILPILQARPEAFRRMRSIESVFQEMAGPGLFSSEGKAWADQRRLLMPAFNTSHLKQFFSALSLITGRLQNYWEKNTAKGTDTDIQRDLMKYTVDVTTQLAFGYDLNSLEDRGGNLQRDLESIFPTLGRRINAPFPYWRYLKLPADRKSDHALADVKAKVREIVEETRSRMKNDPKIAEAPRNFLEAFLATDNDSEKNLSEEEIFGNLLTILVAGEDTTANSMAWMIHFMVENPAVQTRMREEIQSVLGTKLGLSAYDEATRLPYTEAVALEAMRLKPVAPFLFLETNADFQVAKTHCPPGTNVIALTSAPALSEEYFTEAASFRPERWLSEERPAQWKHHQKAFLPFGAGARFCPGRSLAFLEIKIVMATLLQNFTLKRADHAHPKLDEQFTFATVPVNLWVKLEKRPPGLNP